MSAESRVAVFHQYAKYYNDLYQDKDYASECNFLEEVFTRFDKKKVESVLDLGCGTGGHALLLAERGFEVSGVDLSEQMLAVAWEQSQQRRVSIELQQGDIGDLDLGKKFDAVIAMFAVVGYQISNEDLLNTFGTARKHLRAGGIFTFDVWFGPAVLSVRPEQRFKVIQKGDNGERIIRLAEPRLDIMGHYVEVNYTIYEIEDGRMVNEVQETHRNRFYFPKELEMLLASRGLACREICPFMRLGQRCSSEDWNVSVIATAI